MKTKVTLLIINLTCAILLFALPQPSSAQSNTPPTVSTFLHIDGIPGSSTNANHKDWVDCLSFSGGLTQPSGGSVSAAGGHSGGRASFDNLKIIKAVDKASPKLVLATAKGDHIQTVTLEVTDSNANGTFFIIKLTDVVVKSVLPTGTALSMWEEVSFAFGRIDWTSRDVDPVTRILKGTTSGWFDLRTNKGG